MDRPVQPIIDVPTAAARRHVSRTAIYLAIQYGRLKSRNLDGTAWVYPDEVDTCSFDPPWEYPPSEPPEQL